MGKRLFQCFKQGIAACRKHALGLVNDKEPKESFKGRERSFAQQLTDGLDRMQTQFPLG